MVVACPCCGQSMESALTKEQLAYVKFGFVETTMLRTLLDSYPNFVPKSRIVNAVYAYDAPLSYGEVLSIAKKKLSNKLEPFGWTIISRHGGRSGAHYALRKV